jgi:two-component system OmpR family response regulator
VLAPRVLVVEDDADLRSLLRRGLTEEGFAVSAAATGAELLERAPAEQPEAVILDIGLPDADGRDVCQALRAQGVIAPVLFLTARDALTDKVGGFAAGGDDYLTKPFEFAELVVRLRALLRRSSAVLLDARGLRLDPGAHAAFVGEARLPLTPTEFRVLGKLLGRPGEVVRRRELVAAAWPHGARVRDNTLDAYVARIRRKLDSAEGAPTIRTVHGVGYVLE